MQIVRWSIKLIESMVTPGVPYFWLLMGILLHVQFGDNDNDVDDDIYDDNDDDDDVNDDNDDDNDDSCL